MPPWNGVKTLGIPLALAAASFAVCLLAVELALRLTSYDVLGVLAEGRQLILRESDHPLRMYELVPNAIGFGWDTEIRVNSHGMRAREYPVARTGAARIAVMGDSVTFGNWLEPHERFTEQLELILAEQLGGPVEVMNFGVGGYDTIQEVATLEDVGIDFSPDLVVIAYCVNDVADYSPNLGYVRSLKSLDSWIYRSRALQFIRVNLDKLWLGYRLHLDNQEERFRARFGDQIAPVSDDPRVADFRRDLAVRLGDSDELPLAWYLSDPHLGRVDYAFGWLREIDLDQEFEVVVAIMPFLAKSEGYDVVYRLVEHMAGRHGFNVINVGALLAAQDLADLRASPGDTIHANARGHRAFAEVMAPVLARKLGDRGAWPPPGRAASTGRTAGR